MNEQNNSKCGALSVFRSGVLLAGAAAGAMAAANALIAWNTPPLGGRLNGGFYRYPSRHGDMAYFVSGSGAPLLLLHALRPGNSSSEWENNFEALAAKYTVYAPDFLGWGLSDKPHHFLRPEDYAEQTRFFVEDVIAADQGASTPCVVVASGEACTFALMAAEAAPELFDRFVLICPASSDEYFAEAEEISSTEDKPAEHQHPVYKLLTLPVIGKSLLNFLTSRSRLEAAAREELFFGKERVQVGWITRLYTAAHQPGTQTALAAHIAGVLSAPWRKAWENLKQPALLIWGRNATPNGFDTAPEWLALKPDADLEVFDEAKLVPHVEHAEDFNARLLKWLAN